MVSPVLTMSRSSIETTDGSILPESVVKHLLPCLPVLGPTDVFVDVGSSDGSLVFTVATSSAVGQVIGLECVRARHEQACLAARGHGFIPLGGASGERRPTSPVQADVVMFARPESPHVPACTLKLVDVTRGTEGLLASATVVFMNNVLFGPHMVDCVLRAALHSPHFKTLCTLRPICPRHRPALCGRHMPPAAPCMKLTLERTAAQPGLHTSWSAIIEPFFIYNVKRGGP